MAINPISIFIAERNIMSNQLLAEALGKDPRFDVAIVAPAPRILSLVPREKAAVAVISAELESGPTKGMHLARSLRARSHDISIVMLLESLEREKVIASFRSGAKGVFCRTQPVSELYNCIERVSQGKIWAGRAEAEYLLDAIQSTPTCDGLDDLNKITRRECEVAELAVQGLNNKQIARRLGLSEHTIKNHLFHIFDKLNVANRIELLFLMVKGREVHSEELALQLFSHAQPVGPYVAAAAEKGFILAQLSLGLAHLEGRGVEQNDHAGYHWLRVAESNCSLVLEQSRCALDELRSRLPAEDIQELEQQFANKQQEDKQAHEQFETEFSCRSKVA